MTKKASARSSPSASGRERVLSDALHVVTGQRDAQYGGPEDNFSRIAEMWSTYKKVQFTAEDVAAMMVLLKIARLAAESGFQSDTWTDIVGYGACGFEVGERLNS